MRWSSILISSFTYRSIFVLALLLAFASPASAEEPAALPPDTTITVVDGGSFTAQIALASTVPGSTFEYRLDATEWQPTAPGFAISTTAFQTHVIEARATSPAGAVDPTPASASFVVYGFFRPSEIVDPPVLTKFTADHRKLRFRASDSGRVVFRIERCKRQARALSCAPFTSFTRTLNSDGRITIVLKRQFRRGAKYRIFTTATSATGEVEETHRTVTAK
jgi:hypothetical protein